jgi:hypothetical protein
MYTMKNILPIAAVLGAGAYLVFFLKNKARAGANLQYVPVDIAINLKKSSLLNIAYTVKIKLINSENASIVVKNINLNVDVEGNDFGNITKTEDFTVAAQSEKIISFDANFSTVGALRLIRQIIQEGLNLDVTVTGFIDTDLGRVTVNYKKKISRPSVTGICGPYSYKVTDCLDVNDCQLAIEEMKLISRKKKGNLSIQDKSRIARLYKRLEKFKFEEGISGPLNVKDNYFLFWKKNRQPVGTKINDVYDYILTCLNTGSKLYEFSIETDKGDKYDAPEFLKLLKSKGFLLSSYSLN